MKNLFFASVLYRNIIAQRRTSNMGGGGEEAEARFKQSVDFTSRAISEMDRTCDDAL